MAVVIVARMRYHWHQRAPIQMEFVIIPQGGKHWGMMTQRK